MISIERIEDGIAVLEIDGVASSIDAALLPQQAREGDLLLQTERGYQIDREGTALRRAALLEKRNKLRHRRGAQP